MAQDDFNILDDSLGIATVSRFVTAGQVVPNGGGQFIHAFASQNTAPGASGRFVNLVNFAPMVKGGSVRAAIQRAPSGGTINFAPLMFIGLQGPSVNDLGYLAGLSDGDPAHFVVVKGRVVDGLPDFDPDPVGNTVLLKSVQEFASGEWAHLRLDMIVNDNGEVIVQPFLSDLGADPVTAPDWGTQPPPGMEGPLSEPPPVGNNIFGFVDDPGGINSGSAPFTSGRIGFAFQTTDTTRRGFHDHFEAIRQT